MSIYIVMRNGSSIPAEGLYLLRYHSFYPWHTPKNGIISYTELACEFDWYMLPLVKSFQKADLYSKVPKLPPLENLEARYKLLLEKYIPDMEVAW
jgi:inositol oxygenase